jgi:hypothetical protein
MARIAPTGRRDTGDLPPAPEESGSKFEQEVLALMLDRAASSCEMALRALGKRSGGERFNIAAGELADFAYFVAGVATGPLMADNPGYVFPAEKVTALVRDAVESRFGFDVSELPGYTGIKVPA